MQYIYIIFESQYSVNLCFVSLQPWISVHWVLHWFFFLSHLEIVWVTLLWYIFSISSSHVKFFRMRVSSIGLSVCLKISSLFLHFYSMCCSVGWGCRIHRLHFCRDVRPPQWVSWYDTKQSDGEVPVMLDL